MANQIREYTTSGTLENNFSNLNFDPTFIAVSEPDMYVTNFNLGTVSEYNTITGATINSSLISGLDYPEQIALVGSDLYVANEGSGTIGEYDIHGDTINSALITGLNGPNGLAVVTNVPEPASASMMILTGAIVLRRRQRRA
jgi:DNA-binding beta-propeller fold protein YncE